MSLLSVAARSVTDWVKLGFPESVAKRIVSGELPMDEASRMKRAEEQGYGDVLYHGSTHDIKEFDGLLTNTENDMGQGIYLSDSLFDVNNNYAGEGPDLTNRIQNSAEMIADDLESSWSQNADFWDKLPGGGGGKLADEIDALAEDGKYEEAAMMAARAINKGPSDGAVYPVRVKGDGIVSSRDRIETRDYHTEAAEDLGYDPSDLTDEQIDEVSELAYELEADDWQSVENSARSVASEYGADDVYIEPDSTWNEVRNALGVEMYDEDGMPIGSGQALAQVLQGEGVKGYQDLESASRFAGMASGKHTIMFPGSENQIRSVNAAFDPQYKGANILGGADPRLLAGIAAGGGAGSAAVAGLSDGAMEAINLLSESVERARADRLSKVPDARTAEEQRVANHRRAVINKMAELGLLEDPMYEYGTFIPSKTNIASGETSLAVPTVVRGLIQAIIDLGSTTETGVYNPEAALDLI